MSIQSECPALKLIVPPHPTKKKHKKNNKTKTKHKKPRTKQTNKQEQ